MVKIIDIGIGLEQSLDIPNHVELFEAQFTVVEFSQSLYTCGHTVRIESLPKRSLVARIKFTV